MATRRKRSAIDRAVYHMRPNHIAARFFSGGRHQTFKAIVKAPFKTKTVHTPKSGRRAYQQRMARERKERVAAVAKQRKQAVADQRAARTQVRQQPPRAPRRSRQQAPVVLSPFTGKPVTYREALASSRRAEREADRILTGKPARAPRRTKAPSPKTPLQAAIDEVKKNQPRRKGAAKSNAVRKPTVRKNARRKVEPYAPILAGTAPQQVGRPGRSLTGLAMAITCACHGTGRIPAYGPDGKTLAGTTSCPEHGRAGKRRGQKRLTTRRAIRESGLPGLSKWLIKRRDRKRGNSDKRQSAASDRARRYPRLAGPTKNCEWCQGGIVDRKLTEHLRAEFIVAALTEDPEASEKRLEKEARRAYPHMLCSTCGGLGVVKTAVQLRQDGSRPVAEWRVGANLKRGRRLTGREKATGKRMTENARRVERRRKLPRL